MTGEPLSQLWLLTASLCDETVTATWLQERLTAVQTSEAAHQFAARENELSTRLHHDLADAALTELEAVCA